MSMNRTLELLTVTLTNIDNLISSQLGAINEQLKVSREADYHCRKELFREENLPEYWEKIEKQLKKTKSEKKRRELEELLKRKPKELVPTSVDIIVGCGGGERSFRKTLARYVDALCYKFSRPEDYYYENYVIRQRAKRKYIHFLYELSKDYLVKNNDIHELSLSSAQAIQRITIVAQRAREAEEEEAKRRRR